MPISHKHSAFVYPEYISPLPADELIRVGTIKQQLYNEGVAKVQNQIDTLDQYGFSIVKEEDKKYFSQEMDKFMKTINEGAAKTDFANINSLRDLLSVGRPLETDPLIMNALKSSQEIQRRQKVLSSLDSKDRGAANDYYFMEDAYDYLNDGKVGSTLSSGKEYLPYIDVNAKIAEKIKNLKPDIFKGLSQRRDGLLDIVTTEYLTNAKVAQFIKSELDEKELMQLNMNARHSLKQLGVQNIQEMALQDFQQRYELANLCLVTAIPNLEKAKLMYQTSPTALNREQLDRAEADVEDLNIQLESAYENAQKFADVNQIDENVYYPYYLDNYITSKSRNYSQRKEEHDYKPDDIYIKNLEHNLNSARDYQKFLYDKQLKEIETESINPLNGLPYNNKPSKGLSDGVPTASVSTGGGEAGKILQRIPNILDQLAQMEVDLAKDKVPDSEIKKVEEFRLALSDAAQGKGLNQLANIAKVFNDYLGKGKPGKAYHNFMWSGLYSTVTLDRRAYIDPKDVEIQINNRIVNPLNSVYNELTSKKGANTRIAINNSLGYNREVLDGMNFITDPRIFMDPHVILGEPFQYKEITTEKIMPRTGSTIDFSGSDSSNADQQTQRNQRNQQGPD
jgi:hypothetical protein